MTFIAGLLIAILLFMWIEYYDNNNFPVLRGSTDEEKIEYMCNHIPHRYLSVGQINDCICRLDIDGKPIVKMIQKTKEGFDK